MPAKTAKPTRPVPACAQPIERFSDDNTLVTMPTTTRTNKVEHASRRARTCKSVRAFPFGLRTCHDPVVTPARVLSAALLFLPLAATACPIGWTPSPTNATWGPRCYLIPPERSTSLFRCVDVCSKHGGIPGCIGSAEEDAFVTELAEAEEGLWLGLYQIETGLGPAEGWNHCVGGDAPSFTYWLWQVGQPDDYHGYQQRCSCWVTGKDGSGRRWRFWRAMACDGGVRFDDRFLGRSFLTDPSCLCVHGNASAAFAHDRKALEATSGYNQRLLSRRTAICFSIAAVLALLPTFWLHLVKMRLRQLYRGADTESSAGPQGAATVSPSLPAAGATLLSTPSGTASSAMWTSLPLEIRDAIAAHVFGGEGVVDGERLQNLLSLVDLSPSFVRHAAALKQRSQVLARAHERAKRVAARRAARHAARESAAVREQRVCFAAAQVAWAALVIGLTPLFMFRAGQSIEAAVGDSAFWNIPALCAGVFLFLYCLPDNNGDSWCSWHETAARERYVASLRSTRRP